MKFMQHDKNRHFLMSSHKVTKGHNRKTCVHPGKGHNEVVDRSNVKNGNVKNENQKILHMKLKDFGFQTPIDGASQILM